MATRKAAAKPARRKPAGKVVGGVRAYRWVAGPKKAAPKRRRSR